MTRLGPGAWMLRCLPSYCQTIGAGAARRGGTFTQPTDPTGFAIEDCPRVPHLGEQRDAVLGAVLGLGAEQIESLAPAGAFAGVPAGEPARRDPPAGGPAAPGEVQAVTQAPATGE
jgi:hypothetical protein